MDKNQHVDVCIVGGGICGILAAQGCVERGLSFLVFEQGEALGGCWQTLANAYSTLQVRMNVSAAVDATIATIATVATVAVVRRCDLAPTRPPPPPPTPPRAL